jgi:hypothetical protein
VKTSTPATAPAVAAGDMAELCLSTSVGDAGDVETAVGDISSGSENFNV